MEILILGSKSVTRFMSGTPFILRYINYFYCYTFEVTLFLFLREIELGATMFVYVTAPLTLLKKT